MDHVWFPIAALASLKPTEVVALIKLMAKQHSSGSGQCWHRQSVLAEGTTMSPAAMQRAIAGLAGKKAVTITRRFATSNIYTLAEPYRRKPKPVTEVNLGGPREPIPAAAAHTPENDKRRRSQEGSEKDLENLRGAVVRRAAPPRGANPHARRLWLQRINAYAGEELAGAEQWAAWEAIAAKQAGTLSRDQQRIIDGIDRQMRACGYKMALHS